MCFFQVLIHDILNDLNKTSQLGFEERRRHQLPLRHIRLIFRLLEEDGGRAPKRRKIADHVVLGVKLVGIDVYFLDDGRVRHKYLHLLDPIHSDNSIDIACPKNISQDATRLKARVTLDKVPHERRHVCFETVPGISREWHTLLHVPLLTEDCLDDTIHQVTDDSQDAHQYVIEQVAQNRHDHYYYI